MYIPSIHTFVYLNICVWALTHQKSHTRVTSTLWAPTVFWALPPCCSSCHVHPCPWRITAKVCATSWKLSLAFLMCRLLSGVVVKEECLNTWSASQYSIRGQGRLNPLASSKSWSNPAALCLSYHELPPKDTLCWDFKILCFFKRYCFCHCPTFAPLMSQWFRAWRLFQVFSSKCAFEPRRRKAKDANRMAGSSLDPEFTTCKMKTTKTFDNVLVSFNFIYIYIHI